MDEDIQDMLDGWRKDNAVEASVEFKGYDDLGKNIIGRCKSWPGKSEVWLSRSMEDAGLGLMKKSVLWHEMCHAIAYHEDDKGNGHDARWRELRNSKPLYRLGDFLAKIRYGPGAR